MDRLERGTRTLRTIEKITPEAGRGRVTLWNPTPDTKTTITLHADDARLITQLYAALGEELKEKFLVQLATAAGLHKILSYAWNNASYRVSKGFAGTYR